MRFTIIITFLIISGMLHVSGYSAANNPTVHSPAINDSSVYREIKGVIKDIEDRDPVVFANVFIIGTGIGTVTNLQGEFILKIPEPYYNGEIGVSSLGYKLRIISIPDIKDETILIELTPTPFTIQEVVVRNKSALELIREAKYSIYENYGEEPAMLTAFYRETIKQNRNYVSVSEAVLDVYKSSYKRLLDSDRIKIYKGRKSEDPDKIDTLVFKLQGGPYNAFLLDLVKHPGEILSEEFLDMYDYKLRGIVSIEDRDSYLIEFQPKFNESIPIYEGKIYIDVKSLAFAGVDIKINENKLEDAAKMLIVKKPKSIDIEIPGASYLVKYRLIDGRWFVSYIRSEAQFKVKWKKKLFNSNYMIMSELAVTDRDLENIVKHPFRESTKSQDILSDNISNFDDPDFWGEYNIIQPDQTIEEAIRKLNKKLKRKMP